MRSKTLIFAFAFAVIASADAFETTSYDTAQTIQCEDSKKITMRRNVVFMLTVERQNGFTYLSYRDGRPGAGVTSYAVKDSVVTCTVTPVDGPAADPIRHFNGPHELSCKDNGMVVGFPVQTTALTERLDGDMLVYDYTLALGGSQQSLFVPASTGECQIRALN